MTDDEYFEELMQIAKSLERVAKARPYDPEAYNDVVEQISLITGPREQRRRRRPWWAIATILMLLIILAWIVYEVLLVLHSGGAI